MDHSRGQQLAGAGLAPDEYRLPPLSRLLDLRADQTHAAGVGDHGASWQAALVELGKGLRAAVESPGVAGGEVEVVRGE